MKKLYFLPEWFVKNQEANKIKTLKILVFIFLLIDIILMNMYLINLNKTRIIDKKINQLTSMQENSNINSSDSKVKGSKTENTFSVLYKEILINTNFQSVSVEENDIVMDLNPKVTEYNSLINSIEKNNKFTINQISSLSDGHGNQYYNINLRLK